MFRKVFSIVVLAGALLTSVAAQAAAAAGNCKEGAVAISPSATVYNRTLLREWDTTWGDYVWDGSQYVYVQTGGWVDQASDADTANHLGGYWLAASLTKGKDYVFAFKLETGTHVSITPKVTPTYTRFSSVTVDGWCYYYIRASDWIAFDSATVDYYLEVFGPRGSVGQAFSVQFRQADIGKVLPEVPGTLTCPIALDVTANSSVTVSASPAREPWNRLTTAYSAALKANEIYTFTGLSAVPGMDAYLDVWDGDALPATIKRDWRDDGMAVTSLTVQTTAACTMTLLVMPDNLHWETGTMAGGTLSWRLGPLADPEPVSAGVYTGELLDDDTARVSARFSVVARLMDDGSENFSARVTIDGAERVFEDNGSGEIKGVWLLDGKIWNSYFWCELRDDGRLEVDGSLYHQGGSGVEELFYSGMLEGRQVPWSDSLLPFDPSVDSAADMGVMTPAFSGEKAGSETLVKLYGWATAHNVGVAQVNTMAFAEAGDPMNCMSAAYLLDCRPTDEAVASASSAVVITAFDLTTGVTVANGFRDGDALGHGRIQIRSAENPAGPFDITPKAGATRLFYRAYLVK